MVSTFETRLDRRETEPEWAWFLEAWASLFGRVERCLYRERLKGRTRNELKESFQVQFGINARQFNSIWTGLDGKIRSRKECYKLELDELKAKLKRVESGIKKEAKKKAPDAIFLHQKKRRKTVLEHRLAEVEHDSKRDIPPMCFGSKKLFRAQNDGREHSGWLGQWRKARASQIYLVGSRDETAGCQVCQMSKDANGELVLSLKVPPGLEDRFGKRVRIVVPKFKYGQDEIDAALAQNALRAHFKRTAMQAAYGPDHHKTLGRALTYRFVHDRKGWRILVSVEREKLAVQKVSREGDGAIGIDVNVDHVALTEIDRHGNPVEALRIPWNTRGKSTGRALALTRDVAKAVVAFAWDRGKPLVRERLDFAKKKRELKSAGENRRLSSFAYSNLLNAIEAKAARDGIEVFSVNPAFTSVIGRVKFARRYGLGSHQAAALVIARRHFRFNERIPMRPAPVSLGRYQVTFWPLAKTAGEHVWKCWGRVQSNLKRQIASVRRPSSPRPPATSEEHWSSPAQVVAASP